MRDASGQIVRRGKGTTVAEIETGHVYCVLDGYDERGREDIQRSQPMTFQFFERHLHIDPFTEQYEVEHLLEGTVRASGGIEVGTGAATTIPGLFAAGDTTSREKLVGSNQSGAGPATAWALASGSWAGHSATLFAKRFGNSVASRKVESTGGAGLRPTGHRRADLDVDTLIRGVQDETLPVAKFYRRNGEYMTSALNKLNGLWNDAREGLAGDETLSGAAAARSVVRAREAASMIASARWIFASALERTESRGLHRRSDYPDLDPTQHQHVVTGGLDDVWVKRKPVSNSYLEAAAS